MFILIAGVLIINIGFDLTVAALPNQVLAIKRCDILELHFPIR